MDIATTPSWIALLVQVPLVGVFIWYSLEMAKRGVESQRAFMDALEKRDTYFDARNTAVIRVIDNLNTSICHQIDVMDQSQQEHDRYVREKLTKPVSRSRSKGANELD